MRKHEYKNIIQPRDGRWAHTHTQQWDAGRRGLQCRERDQRQGGDEPAAPLLRQVKVIHTQTGEQVQSGRVEEQSANPDLLHALVHRTELLEVLDFLHHVKWLRFFLINYNTVKYKQYLNTLQYLIIVLNILILHQFLNTRAVQKVSTLFDFHWKR